MGVTIIVSLNGFNNNNLKERLLFIPFRIKHNNEHIRMQLGILFIPIPIPAYLFGPIYLFIEYLADKKGNTGIAHDAHIGGAIFGVIFILLINFDKGKEFFYLIFK